MLPQLPRCSLADWPQLSTPLGTDSLQGAASLTAMPLHAHTAAGGQKSGHMGKLNVGPFLVSSAPMGGVSCCQTCLAQLGSTCRSGQFCFLFVVLKKKKKERSGLCPQF